MLGLGVGSGLGVRLELGFRVRVRCIPMAPSKLHSSLLAFSFSFRSVKRLSESLSQKVK